MYDLFDDQYFFLDADYLDESDEDWEEWMEEEEFLSKEDLQKGKLNDSF